MNWKVERLIALGWLVGVTGCAASQDDAAAEVTTVSSALTSAACADGSAEQVFTNGLVGCAGKVTWDNRARLCAAGYRPATAAEWAALGGTTPQHDYWTDDYLRFTGTSSGACGVSRTAGSSCGATTPMRVCTSGSGSDPEGNVCNWTNCGLEGNAPNRFFGGCAGDLTAGTLCIPDGCADSTVEQYFPNGMVGCGGAATSAAAAAPLCAPGYRLASAPEFVSLNRPEIRVPNTVAPSRNYWTQTAEFCPPSGCVGTTAGAICVPQRGCADGSAEQVMPDGLVGCAGTATWANRDSLCAPGYQTATANEWRTVNQLGGTITPAHDYWTADGLSFNGSASSCWVSTSGSNCGGQPMRLCTASGADAEGNACNWTNCGLDTVSPNLHFGGCSGNTTAGALCVPTDIAANSIVHQDPTLSNLLSQARAQFNTAPAIAAAIVVDGKIYLATAGKRKSTDTSNTLQETDKFQLDSVSKAISGAVLARAVDQGAISWTDTMVSRLPSSIFASPAYTAYQNVTLGELEAHASGFDYDSTAHQYGTTPDAANDYANYVPTDRRLFFTRDYLRDAPLFPHGSAWIYGTGAVPAISMLEQTTNKTPYETLLVDYLFRPLGMAHSGTVMDVWQHHLVVAPDGTQFLQSPVAPADYTSSMRLPVGGVAASIEDVGRFLHAALYSPRAPWRAWSSRTEQPLQNGVSQSVWSPAGWLVDVNNAAGGLELWHNGCAGLNKSQVSVWPMRGVAMAVLTNYAEDGCVAPALEWVWGQLPSLLGSYGVPPATFPLQESLTIGATNVSASTVWGAGWEATKAFDGDYSSRWAAADSNTSAAWLQVILPSAAPVGHIIVNEAGTFPASPDVTSRFDSTDHAQQFRVTSYSIYLRDRSGNWATTAAATGTTIGANKLISVNGYAGITGAKLVMNATVGPTINEMHLLPW